MTLNAPQKLSVARNFAFKELSKEFKKNSRRIPERRYRANLQAYDNMIKDKIANYIDLRSLIVENPKLFVSSIELTDFDLMDEQQFLFFDENIYELQDNADPNNAHGATKSKSVSFENGISIGTQYEILIENIIGLIDRLLPIPKDLLGLNIKFSSLLNTE